MLSSCHKDDDEIVIINQTDTTIVNNYYFDANFVIQDQKPIEIDIRPDFLKEGDLVAICAASNAVTENEISTGISTLKSWGLNVLEASNLYNKDGRYAGSLGERVKGLQEIVDNPEVKAIFMARGGYGAAQVIPYIKWDKMLENPKWLIGYSDVTAIHITLNNSGLETILGPMMVGFTKDANSLSALKQQLFGNFEKYEMETNSNCVTGTATGRLVGGNLSLIYSLGGTPFDLNTMNSILFIEDTGEANYSVDRMLLNLQESGKLENIKGVIVGQIIKGTQGSDLPINEIVKKYFGNLNIPIIYGFQNGHDTQNLPLMLGSEVTISVDNEKASIVFANRNIAK